MGPSASLGIIFFSFRIFLELRQQDHVSILHNIIETNSNGDFIKPVYNAAMTELMILYIYLGTIPTELIGPDFK